jgi:hypothetical protein
MTVFQLSTENAHTRVVKALTSRVSRPRRKQQGSFPVRLSMGCLDDPAGDLQLLTVGLKNGLQTICCMDAFLYMYSTCAVAGVSTVHKKGTAGPSKRAARFWVIGEERAPRGDGDYIVALTGGVTRMGVSGCVRGVERYFVLSVPWRNHWKGSWRKN